eukprot:227098-Amphidinium_carterae.1
MRRIVGSTLWIARQTRPDCLTMVSLLAQKIGNPTLGDLHQANALVDRMQEDATFGLTFHSHRDLCCLDLRCVLHEGVSTVRHDPSVPSTIDVAVFGEEQSEQVPGSKQEEGHRTEHEELCLFVASDAAFANVDQVASQAGYVLGIRHGSKFHLWDCASYKIRRVCRSTLSAESNALVEGTEYLDYVRQVVFSILTASRMTLELPTQMDIPTQWYTDSKSLFDVVSMDTSLVSDKRLHIVIAQLRQLYSEGCVAFAWIDTQVMIADSLTKLEMSDLFFKECLSTGVWSSASTEESLARKALLQGQRRERKRLQRLAKSESLSASLGEHAVVFWVGGVKNGSTQLQAPLFYQTTKVVPRPVDALQLLPWMVDALQLLPWMVDTLQLLPWMVDTLQLLPWLVELQLLPKMVELQLLPRRVELPLPWSDVTSRVKRCRMMSCQVDTLSLDEQMMGTLPSSTSCSLLWISPDVAAWQVQLRETCFLMMLDASKCELVGLALSSDEVPHGCNLKLNPESWRNAG